MSSVSANLGEIYARSVMAAPDVRALLLDRPADGGRARALDLLTDCEERYRRQVAFFLSDDVLTTGIRYVLLVPHDGRSCPARLASLSGLGVARIRRLADRERDRGTTKVAREVLARVAGGALVAVRIARLWDCNRLPQRGPNWVSFLPAEAWPTGEVLAPDASPPASLLDAFYWPAHRFLACLFALVPGIPLLFELHSMDDRRGVERPASQLFHLTEDGQEVTPTATVDLVRSILTAGFGEPCAIDTPYAQAAGFANFQLQYNLRARSGLATGCQYVCMELAKRTCGEPFPEPASGCQRIVPSSECAGVLGDVLRALLEPREGLAETAVVEHVPRV